MKKEQKRQGRAFALVLVNPNVDEDVVLGTLFICGHSTHILINSGSTHSFVAPQFTSKLTSTPKSLGYALSVFFWSGGSAFSIDVYKSCAISLKGEILYVDFVPLCISGFDVS